MYNPHTHPCIQLTLDLGQASQNPRLGRLEINMPAAIDALVGTFTSTTFALIFGAYLTPTCIRRVFTTVLSIDTRGQFGDFVSLDSTGQCRLGQEVWSCSEMMKAVLSYDLGEYESEDELTELAHHAQAMIDPRKCLLASTWICKSCLSRNERDLSLTFVVHGTLIVACYALLAFAWEMTTPTECPILLRTTMKPLRWFVVFTMTLATASGIMATVSPFIYLLVQ